jgi:hypothetical protein
MTRLAFARYFHSDCRGRSSPFGLLHYTSFQGEIQMIYVMPKAMYDLYIHGRKKTDNLPEIRGFGDKNKLIEYINETFGLLGVVTDIHVKG